MIPPHRSDATAASALSKVVLLLLLTPFVSVLLHMVSCVKVTAGNSGAKAAAASYGTENVMMNSK